MNRKKYETPKREKQGIITGSIGLGLNLALGGGKLAAGLLTGSVAVTSDAVNNLSDAGSSLVTVGSFLLGGRKADREHPYGHGRYEYIAGFLIGIIIIMVGLEFFIGSIKKVITPVAVRYGALTVSILCVSVAVKLAMGVFYKVMSVRLKSETLKAASFDSFSDCLVTGALLLSMLINLFVSYPLDGVAGLVISAVVVIGGIKLISGTVGDLLGKSCTPEFAAKIESIVESDAIVKGTHDLQVHEYGPGRTHATIHAEVDENVTVVEAHRVLDAMERRALAELNTELVIHCDPIDTADETLNRIRRLIKDVISQYTLEAGLHDLNIDYAAARVEFHLRLPCRLRRETQFILQRLRASIENVLVGYECEIEVDYVY